MINIYLDKVVLVYIILCIYYYLLYKNNDFIDR